MQIHRTNSKQTHRQRMRNCSVQAMQINVCLPLSKPDRSLFSCLSIVVRAKLQNPLTLLSYEVELDLNLKMAPKNFAKVTQYLQFILLPGNLEISVYHMQLNAIDSRTEWTLILADLMMIKGIFLPLNFHEGFHKYTLWNNSGRYFMWDAFRCPNFRTCSTTYRAPL